MHDIAATGQHCQEREFHAALRSGKQLQASEQERQETWIMGEVEGGASLPGLYPPNAENKARYEAWKSRR